VRIAPYWLLFSSN